MGGFINKKPVSLQSPFMTGADLCYTRTNLGSFLLKFRVAPAQCWCSRDESLTAWELSRL